MKYQKFIRYKMRNYFGSPFQLTNTKCLTIDIITSIYKKIKNQQMYKLIASW